MVALILGTGTGKVLVRNGVGDWTTVHSMVDTTNEIWDIVRDPTNLSNIEGYQHNTNISFNSTDGGRTWTNHSTINPKATGTVMPWTDNGSLVGYTRVGGGPFGLVAPFDIHIWITTDFGVTWTNTYTETASSNTSGQIAYANGKVWWVVQKPSDSLPYLHGVHPEDGTGFVELGGFSSSSNFGLYYGGHAFPRLYIQDQHTSGGGWYIHAIDVSNSASPTEVEYSLPYNPNGGQTRYCWAEVSSEIFVINTKISGVFNGGIWRTTDHGATWTNVVVSETNMYQFPFNGQLNPMVEYSNELWMIGRYPYLWHSTDAGVTWAQETGPSIVGEFAYSALQLGQGPPPVPGIGVYLATAPNTQFRFTEIT